MSRALPGRFGGAPVRHRKIFDRSTRLEPCTLLYRSYEWCEFIAKDSWKFGVVL
jgi:hypothetical protein